MKKKILSLLAVVSLIIVSIITIIARPQQPAAPPPAPQQAPPVARGSVSGIVTKSGTAQPLKSARVSLQRVDAAARGNAANPIAALLANGNGLGARAAAAGGAAALSAVTDTKGQFAIADVPAGQYRISAEGDGFIRQEFGQKTSSGQGTILTIAPGQALTADIQLRAAGTISGRVRDEYGEPLARTTVNAYSYRYNNGTRSMTQIAAAQTNDLGEYRLIWLQPGEYFVGVVRAANAGNGNVQLANLLGNNANAAAIQPLIQQFTQGGSSPAFYFPGVTEPEQATAFKIAASTEMPGVDFSLRAIPAYTLRGRVVAPFSLNPPPQANAARGGQRGAAGGAQNGGQNGGQIGGLLNNLPANLGQGVQVSLTRAGATQNALAALGLGGLGGGGTQVAADGSFEIRNVSSGTYTLTATARDPNNQQYTARTQVEVASADVNNLALAVRAGVEIQGKILMDSSLKPIDLTKLRVTLVSADDPTGGQITGLISQFSGLLAAAPAAAGRGGAAPAQGANGNGGAAPAAGARGGAAGAAAGGQAQALAGLLGNQGAVGTVTAEGSFTLANVSAFEYRVRVTGLPAGYYVKAGRIGTVDPLNTPFSIAQSETMQLQLASGMGKVSGTVLDLKGAPASGALTVLIPDPSRRGRSEMYFSSNADPNGKYSFSNVPPGSYKVFSWEDIPAGAYQYPDFVRSYEDRGQAITVEADGAVETEVRLIESQI